MRPESGETEMTQGKSGCDPDAAKTVRKLTLPDGFRVGIKNLDNILLEVEALKLNDDKAVKAELLKRVKSCNYVAPVAEDEYAVALFREYRRKFGEPGVTDSYKTETHLHTKG
jgi:hypothetical protein